MFTANDVEKYLYPAIKQGQHVERTDMQNVFGRNMLVRLLQVVIIGGLAGLFIYHALLK
ncbi:MAG: hypothetical protein K0U68_00030 [Gammaproteobacteria bacterium]|nr:hypothetical protein [Gammaproteobacteria bacterium]